MNMEIVHSTGIRYALISIIRETGLTGKQARFMIFSEQVDIPDSQPGLVQTQYFDAIHSGFDAINSGVAVIHSGVDAIYLY